jgi:hypothetical protein
VPSDKKYTALLKASSQEAVPPNPARLLPALRNIGYKLEHAISDLIDNSINARANNILIRFLTGEDKIQAVVIADDGDGMGEERITEAMRFGADEDFYPEGSLGKYGMGLKLASLSHAEVLTVISRKKGKACGRRWTPEGIAKGWYLDKLDRKEIEPLLNDTWNGLDLSKNGTLVVWKKLDKLPTSPKGLEQTLRTIKNRLRRYLGLIFHRFISDGRISIKIDHKDINEPETNVFLTTEPLDPFKYGNQPHDDYPRLFTVDMPEIGKMKIRTHIWPANSDSPEYKLGGNAASRQGFYFYRNDRLIQVGGWNGLVESESEPHGSLARVVVDLPSDLEDKFGLNVQKSAVITPSNFIPSLKSSTSASGITFEDFRRTAQEVYRKSDDGHKHVAPMIPAGDIPADIEKMAKTWFKDSSGKFRKIKVKWSSLKVPQLFILKLDTDTIILNENYRKQILGQRRRGKNDLPFVKTALFFMLRDFFKKKRLSKKDRELLDKIDAVLREAIDKGKG